MNHRVSIVADYREVRSTLPEILKEKGAYVELQNLKTGDYIVNNSIQIERKTKDDFALSILQNRLFSQCARMRKSAMLSIVLIEGNPYQTSHNISREAIKGALISVSIAWQIPIVYAKNIHDSAEIMLMAGHQYIADNYKSFRRGIKPKKTNSKLIYFLQGLPSIGTLTAKALLNEFASPKNVISASEEDLKKVEGIGKAKAKLIRDFLSTEYQEKSK